MRLLDLQTGNKAIVDDADWPIVEQLTVYEGTNGYAYYSTWENGRSVPRTLHSRLVDAPPGMHIDHINGDKLDNRRSNLRVVTPQQNQLNRKRPNRNNTSGARGVSRHSACDRWVAQITKNGKNHYLGLYERMEDAIAARKAAELELFGEVCP